MMKSTKPISSPGRTTEKFPPPLMRFLRSNVGSKSTKRGGRRSRASPMFFRKKNTNIEAIQEPSSPKVTCIGQVRVRRSKKNKKTTTTTTTTNVATTASSSAVRRRKSRNIFCRCFRKLKPRSIFNVLSKWVSFFRCGYCESSTFLDDSPVDVSTPVSVIKEVAGKNGEEQEKEEDINQGLISKSPPKNAFLLTRCRSAPYRSSSLANKFWESGMEKKEDEEEIAEKIKNLKIKIEDENGEVDKEQQQQQQQGTQSRHNGSKCNERNEVEELKAVKEVPLILNRCKSEPAKTWKQLLIV